MIYEYDLNDEILIIERNDLVNLADFSRKYNIIFVYKNDKKQFVKVKLELTSTFRQIASEWMPLSVIGVNFRAAIRSNIPWMK